MPQGSDGMGGQSNNQLPGQPLAISGRESVPVGNMAAPQMQKGRRNPEMENMNDPKTGPRL